MKKNRKFVKKVARNWYAWSSYLKRQTTHITQLWQHFCCGRTDVKSGKVLF